MWTRLTSLGPDSYTYMLAVSSSMSAVDSGVYTCMIRELQMHPCVAKSLRIRIKPARQLRIEPMSLSIRKVSTTNIVTLILFFIFILASLWWWNGVRGVRNITHFQHLNVTCSYNGSLLSCRGCDLECDRTFLMTPTIIVIIV